MNLTKRTTTCFYGKITLRAALKWLGWQSASRFRQVQPVLRARLVLARKSGDDEAAKSISAVASFLKQKLHHGCDICGVTIHNTSRRCSMHVIRNVARASLFLLFACSLQAGTVTLRFDPSPTPGVTNYIVFGVQGTNIVTKTNVSLSTTNMLRYTNDTGFYTVAQHASGVASDPSPMFIVPGVVPSGVVSIVPQTFTNTITIITQAQ